ncbi:mechanosensitive ion channel family protein [Mycobacterium sp.]|jgi:small-conductance mechanosensitive channel|uniref:mechanosensitive ion channel family protein n=1 Tax=Mycobacterium sp. TaxID=1785 RepID=UPI002D25D5EF|nr:mechanosensitive ion channel family protein [Mycobacterium sp.]HZA09970.1 mechanosensitive ion channel family protein [Mycobacterium sp.]
MTNVFTAEWFYWAIGVAVGLPVGLVVLTEWHHALVRRHSFLARPVSLLRNYLLPIGALLLLLVKVTQVPMGDTSVRAVATLFGFVVLVLLLSGVNATMFQSAPEGTWRKRVPAIFVDVARFVLIFLGLAMIFSYIWGANVRGLLTALGVTSIVIGLTLQNSVGQIISGLLMLFEQPFRLGDWLDTPAARGRVVEVNWRAVHIETASGLQITPNSVLAGASFTNLSRPVGAHNLSISTTFSVDDPPDEVCALLSRVAGDLPQRKAGGMPSSVVEGTLKYTTTIALKSPADDGPAKATFLRWIWYASRRAGLHLDEAEDEFSTPERIEHALATIVVPTLRLSDSEQDELRAHARMARYGSEEIMQRTGDVPDRLSFLVSGLIRLTATTEDGAVIPVGTLEPGSFLGQTALIRQPVLAGAYAIGEVIVLQLEREHIEHLVFQKPLLLQEFGRVIEERRVNVKRALAAVGG